MLLIILTGCQSLLNSITPPVKGFCPLPVYTKPGVKLWLDDAEKKNPNDDVNQWVKDIGDQQLRIIKNCGK